MLLDKRQTEPQIIPHSRTQRQRERSFGSLDIVVEAANFNLFAAQENREQRRSPGSEFTGKIWKTKEIKELSQTV